MLVIFISTHFQRMLQCLVNVYFCNEILNAYSQMCGRQWLKTGKYLSEGSFFGNVLESMRELKFLFALLELWVFTKQIKKILLLCIFLSAYASEPLIKPLAFKDATQTKECRASNIKSCTLVDLDHTLVEHEIQSIHFLDGITMDVVERKSEGIANIIELQVSRDKLQAN